MSDVYDGLRLRPNKLEIRLACIISDDGAIAIAKRYGVFDTARRSDRSSVMFAF